MEFAKGREVLYAYLSVLDYLTVIYHLSLSGKN